MMNTRSILSFILGTYCGLCLSFRQSHKTTRKVADSFLVLRMASEKGNQDPRLTSVRSSALHSLSTNLFAITAALTALPTIAAARQGAFEMDVEYYLKTVASRAQGKPDAVINAKTAKPAFASARVLNKELANDVVTAVHEEISRIAGVSVPEIVTKVNAQKLLYVPYFKEFVPIRAEDFSDQYFFDITLYVSYLVAAQLIQKSTDRVILRKAVGNRVLDLLMQKGLIGSSTSPKGSILSASQTPDNLQPSRENILAATVAAEKMAVLAKGVKGILSAFAAAKFVGSFTIDEEDIGDKIFAESSFAEGLPVNFQLTVVAPVNLLGFLETAAADTFFHPEIIATTIASYARSLGYKAHYEDYLVDNYYLANGIDTNIVTAQDVLIEMQIATQNSDSPDF